MKLLEEIKENKHLTEDDMKEFINLLLNSKVNNERKVEILKSYTQKQMQQNELTYLVKHLIHTMYPVQPFYEGAMCVCGTGGMDRIVLTFQLRLHLSLRVQACQ